MAWTYLMRYKMIEDLHQLHEQYTKFMKRSREFYKDWFERIKDDRDFLFGNHYSEDDNKRLGKTRLKGQVDVISNTVRSIVNQYGTNPYAWSTTDETVNPSVSKFLQESNVKSNIISGLRNGVSYGLGYYVISTIVDEIGNTVPTLYSIPKVTNVYFDPDSTQIDGSDARQCVIVDIKSKDWIKCEYGEEFVTDKGQKPYFDIEESYDENEMPIITYYYKEKNVVNIYKLLNDQLIEDPVQWVMDRLPVVPVYGEEIYVDDKISYQGIVRQLKPIQKLVDYTYSQLCERLAKSPKNAWIGTKEALEGYEEYYRNFDKSVNPLLIYNKYDDKNAENSAPIRQDMTIQYADLTTLLSNALGLAQTITGVQSIGIPDERSEITATEALLNIKSYANNIRHFFENLKESFKSLGDIFMQLMGIPCKVIVEQGPEDEMSRQTARAELMQLTQMLPEDKRLDLVGAITQTMDNNEYIRNFNMAVFNGQNPEVMRLNQQIQQMQMQFKQAIDQAVEDRKALEMQLQQAQLQIVALENSNKNNVIITQMQIQADIQKKAMELQAKAEGQDKEAIAKLQETAMKQQNENARFVVKLQQENNQRLMNAIK